MFSCCDVVVLGIVKLNVTIFNASDFSPIISFSSLRLKFAL